MPANGPPHNCFARVATTSTAASRSFAMSSSASRIADVLHKTLISGLAGLTVLGAVEVTSEVNFLNRRRAQRRAEAEAAARAASASDAGAQ